MISDEIVLNVTQNVITITFVLFSVFPVIYIVRSMIDFICTAFDDLDIDTVFGGIAKNFKLKKIRKLGD